MLGPQSGDVQQKPGVAPHKFSMLCVFACQSLTCLAGGPVVMLKANRDDITNYNKSTEQVKG